MQNFEKACTIVCISRQFFKMGNLSSLKRYSILGKIIVKR